MLSPQYTRAIEVRQSSDLDCTFVDGTADDSVNWDNISQFPQYQHNAFVDGAADDYDEYHTSGDPSGNEDVTMGIPYSNEKFQVSPLPTATQNRKRDGP